MADIEEYTRLYAVCRGIAPDIAKEHKLVQLVKAYYEELAKEKEKNEKDNKV